MGSTDFRLRVTYRKVGRLRWLSHLEVTRALERGIRRAELPYAVTLGFSPHMRIAYGPALPVGTAGEREALDVWLTSYVVAPKALARLQGSLPEGLEPMEALYVPASAASLSAGTHIGVYDMRIEGKEVSADLVQAALDLIRSEGTLEVQHRRKTKVFDLARSLPKEPRTSDSDGAVNVTLTVRMGPEGSLRPEVLLVHGAVTTVTRTDTLTENQEGVWSRPA
jgi:radical SAM-linked protein